MFTRRHFLRTTTMLAVASAIMPSALLSMLDEAVAADAKVTHSDAEWQKLLTADQYDVLRHAGTERPFSSALLDEHRAGNFKCVGCALPLFSSKTKFDSGTGWPSFYQPLDHAVLTKGDGSFGMMRTAVECSRCAGHLGHMFDDGPAPTGLRYCMNGVAMTFAVSGAA